jgi:tetratricopeptide (TPR) repeat protein
MRITQTRFLGWAGCTRACRIVFVCCTLAASGASISRAAPPNGPGDAAGAAAMGDFAAGVYLLEDGHADQAIEPLLAAWRTSGESPRVGAYLARAYYAVRDVEHADRIAQRVLKTDPARLDMLMLRARVSYGRRDSAAAIRYLVGAREVGVASVESERMLASLYLENGDLEHAIGAVEECVRHDSSIPEIHTLHGELLVEAGRPREAEAAFRAALELDTGEPRAIEQLVRLLESEGRLEDALPVLEGLVARGDAPAAARAKLAEAYLAAGRYADGIRILEAGRGDGPSSDENELLLGRLYFEAGEFESAKKVFQGLYQKSPQSTELARLLGDLSVRTGDAVGARGYFERAIAAGPDDYRNYLALFFAQDKRTTTQGARIELSKAEVGTLLERASSLAPRDEFEAQFMVGMACSSADSLDSARVHLARANELKPGDRGAMFNLASVHEKQGRFEDAERLLAELYALVPDDAAVCNFYGYLLAEMGKDLERAETLVRKALAKEPANGYFLDSLGWVYYRRGEYGHAAGELERAVRIIADDPVILEHLGDAYAALSRFPEALAAYRHSSELQGPSASLREKIESAQRRRD